MMGFRWTGGRSLKGQDQATCHTHQIQVIGGIWGQGWHDPFVPLKHGSSRCSGAWWVQGLTDCGTVPEKALRKGEATHRWAGV
jgi:hypothetical protein